MSNSKKLIGKQNPDVIRGANGKLEIPITYFSRAPFRRFLNEYKVYLISMLSTLSPDIMDFIGYYKQQTALKLTSRVKIIESHISLVSRQPTNPKSL